MIDEAYVMTNQLYSQSNVFLSKNIIGLKDVWAPILRVAIVEAAKIYVKKGALAFELKIRPNEIKNCNHLELHRDAKTLYVARIESVYSLPRHAQYRPITPNFEDDLFVPRAFEDREIDVFVATYGDGGKHEFQFGDIGILGERTWLWAQPLIQGAYVYTSKTEKEEMLVDLADSVIREIGKDEKNAEGESI